MARWITRVLAPKVGVDIVCLRLGEEDRWVVGVVLGMLEVVPAGAGGRPEGVDKCRDTERRMTRESTINSRISALKSIVEGERTRVHSCAARVVQLWREAATARWQPWQNTESSNTDATAAATAATATAAAGIRAGSHLSHVGRAAVVTNDRLARLGPLGRAATWHTMLQRRHSCEWCGSTAYIAAAWPCGVAHRCTQSERGHGMSEQ